MPLHTDCCTFNPLQERKRERDRELSECGQKPFFRIHCCCFIFLSPHDYLDSLITCVFQVSTPSLNPLLCCSVVKGEQTVLSRYSLVNQVMRHESLSLPLSLTECAVEITTLPFNNLQSIRERQSDRVSHYARNLERKKAEKRWRRIRLPVLHRERERAGEREADVYTGKLNANVQYSGHDGELNK